MAQKRSIPKLAKQTLRKWYAHNSQRLANRSSKNGSLYLFVDEFTNYFDIQIGIDSVELLTELGYDVRIAEHEESGRSHLSKGFLDEAKLIANTNISIFKDLISQDVPLIGIEPSAILSFRDEYLRLSDDKDSAHEIAKNTFTIEEFIKNENSQRKISVKVFFTNRPMVVKIHGHCHQKALSSVEPTFFILNFLKNYSVTVLNTGCCGMAGSFGYEKEHYDLSMQVGEDTLFPKIRNLEKSTIIGAPGTSCRHQIFDGTKRIAEHPVSIFEEGINLIQRKLERFYYLLIL